ncbi:MAG: YHS domain-containing protein, partial [Acidobacteriales bacterium]|nr:YHS domain-containing protein [Terriglobales bacterium]
MKARWILSTLCVALLVAVSGLTVAEGDDVKAKKEFTATCPVSGQPAIEDSVLDLAKLKAGEGKVYFCCKNCPKQFEKDPAKFELKVRRQLAETGQIVQVACPVTGRPVNKEVTVELENAKVNFCCKNCLAKYEKADDEGKLKIVFANLEKGFTRQVMCPVSGKPINPGASVEYEGKKVYFCCPGCPDAFNADPKKFLAKLPQFAKADGEARL